MDSFILSKPYDTLAIWSDTHCGSRVGLCPPRWQTKDETKTGLSKVQKQLWRWWLEYWQTVKDIKHPEGKLWCVHDADVVEGLHHGTVQLLADDENEMVDIAYQSHTPMIDVKPDYYFQTMGTRVHVGEAGLMEEQFAALLADRGGLNVVKANDKKWIHDHLKIEVGGVKFDIAHHGKYGRLPWTKVPAAARYAEYLFHKYCEARKHNPSEQIADVVVRAHGHDKNDSGPDTNIRVVYTPSWQAATHYGNQVGDGFPLPIGGVIFICYDGKFDVEKVYNYPKGVPFWKP